MPRNDAHLNARDVRGRHRRRARIGASPGAGRSGTALPTMQPVERVLALARGEHVEREVVVVPALLDEALEEDVLDE